MNCRTGTNSPPSADADDNEEDWNVSHMSPAKAKYSTNTSRRSSSYGNTTFSTTFSTVLPQPRAISCTSCGCRAHVCGAPARNEHCSDHGPATITSHFIHVGESKRMESEQLVQKRRNGGSEEPALCGAEPPPGQVSEIGRASCQLERTLVPVREMQLDQGAEGRIEALWCGGPL
ncbi:hypothetical protein BGZ92_005810 [Podila epicladia]|nr:hypothetical protein BGZ92_005810 [Podila epicladia]